MAIHSSLNSSLKFAKKFFFSHIISGIIYMVRKKNIKQLRYKQQHYIWAITHIRHDIKILILRHYIKILILKFYGFKRKMPGNLAWLIGEVNSLKYQAISLNTF